MRRSGAPGHPIRSSALCFRARNPLLTRCFFGNMPAMDAGRVGRWDRAAGLDPGPPATDPGRAQTLLQHLEIAGHDPDRVAAALRHHGARAPGRQRHLPQPPSRRPGTSCGPRSSTASRPFSGSWGLPGLLGPRPRRDSPRPRCERRRRRRSPPTFVAQGGVPVTIRPLLRPNHLESFRIVAAQILAPALPAQTGSSPSSRLGRCARTENRPGGLGARPFRHVRAVACAGGARPATQRRSRRRAPPRSPRSLGPRAALGVGRRALAAAGRSAIALPLGTALAIAVAASRRWLR